MSVNSYLANLAGLLVIKENEKTGITTSIDAIKRNLDSYFSDIVEKVLFGSYTRETILPRKADENSDIDLMVVFKNSDGYKPQSFLNRLKNFAEHYYSRSEIYQSSPTIVLELNHIKFELVPAVIQYTLYYIPSSNGDWMFTDPNGFNNSLVECNKNNNYKIKPVVRLIKHWNIQKNNRGIKSFLLEKKIAETLKYAYLSCSTYTAYLIEALNSIRDYSNMTQVDQAKNHITKALEYENDNMPYSSESEIKKAFPEI